MILSKLSRYGFRRTDNNLTNYRLLCTYTFRPLQNDQRFQLKNHDIQQIKIKIFSPILLCNSVNGYSYRMFNTNHNPFRKYKKDFGSDAMYNMAIFLIFSILFYVTFDVRKIWEQYTPRIITVPVEFVFSGFQNSVRYVYKKYIVKKADALAANSNNDKVDDNLENLEADSVRKIVLEQEKVVPEETRNSSFRDRRIIEYENRIRLYSNPDKIFRYFASVKINYRNGDSEIYMTPDDFLRALTPGIKQPDGLGLDQFKRVDLEKTDKSQFKFNLQPDSVFYKLSKHGLINFSDFLFLLTLLSVSKRHFEIAFRMFDLNGDGEVEYSEFEKVQNAILQQTSIGKKMGTSVRYKGISSAVSRYFFGNDLKSKLTTKTFVEFQQALQYELLSLEFDRKKQFEDADRISEIDFADLLVAYANLSEKKRQRMIRRVTKKFSNENAQGISKNDYLEFFRFLRNINDVDIALSVYNIAGASIDQGTLKHVAHTVANVELSDHIVNVVFTLFDDNDDGQLSNKEFVAVMKERLRRGLSKPKDTGFFKILYVMWKSIINFEL